MSTSNFVFFLALACFSRSKANEERKDLREFEFFLTANGLLDRYFFLYKYLNLAKRTGKI